MNANPDRWSRARRWARRSSALLLAGGFLLAGATAAFAFWTVTALYAPTNYALAQAASLSAPTAPTATVNGSASITIGWTLPGSQLAGAEYRVTRTSPPGTVCTVASTVSSCTDTGLTAGTAYAYSVAAVLGSSWQSSPITTSATTLGLTTTSLPGGDVGTPYSATLAATGGTGAYTSWALASGTLPSWATLNTVTGTISGTPNAVVTVSGLTFTVTDSHGATATSASLSIAISPALSVTTTTLATATQGQTGYSQTVVSAGGAAPITWSISSGALPAGLTLAPGTGVISGTVGAAATTQAFTVKATDANGISSTRPLGITVNVPPSVTTTTLAAATQTQTGYSQALASTGGTGAITWSISSGSLPAGLTLTGSTGVISGTVGAAATTQAFTVAATDANGVVGTRALSLTVNVPPSVTTTTLASATQGETGYSQPLASTGGTGTITWSVSSGSLPAGLSLASGTGVISGTVSGTATTQTFTVAAADANGVAGTRSLTLTVNPSASLGIGTVVRDGGNKKVHFTGTGGTAGGSITVTICAVNSFPCASPVATSSTGVLGASGNWTSAQDSLNLSNSTNYFAQAVETTPSATSSVFAFTVTGL